MVQSPSSEANWFADSQETPRISRNPKVHYRTHKRPPPVSNLGQPNPVHIHTSHLLEILLISLGCLNEGEGIDSAFTGYGGGQRCVQNL